MNAPKPITLTSGSNPNPGYDPQPMVVVGGIPLPVPATLTAVPATFADEAAVRTFLATLVGELKASPYFN